MYVHPNMWYENDADEQGAMAGHAYKSAVDELDAGVGRDLVSTAGGPSPPEADV